MDASDQKYPFNSRKAKCDFDSPSKRKAVIFLPKINQRERRTSMRKNQTIKTNRYYRKLEKTNFKPDMKRRPVKRTAFHRIGSRKQ